MKKIAAFTGSILMVALALAGCSKKGPEAKGAKGDKR